MRKRGRVDLVQEEIVKALRKGGVTVAVTSALGGGFPDLVCCHHQVEVLLEVKSSHSEPLTAAEREFHEKWGRPISIVTNPDEAFAAVIEAWRGRC